MVYFTNKSSRVMQQEKKSNIGLCECIFFIHNLCQSYHSCLQVGGLWKQEKWSWSLPQLASSGIFTLSMYGWRQRNMDMERQTHTPTEKEREREIHAR